MLHMLGQFALLSLVTGVGFVTGAAVKLYYSFKGFIGNVFEKSLPDEVIEQALEEVKSKWLKWIGVKALSFTRSKLAERTFKILTAPDRLAGALVKIGVHLLAISLITLTSVLSWYFGGISLPLVLALAFLGAAIAYFTVTKTVDRVLDFILVKSTGFTQASVLKGARQLSQYVQNGIGTKPAIVRTEGSDIQSPPTAGA